MFLAKPSKNRTAITTTYQTPHFPIIYHSNAPLNFLSFLLALSQIGLLSRPSYLAHPCHAGTPRRCPPSPPLGERRERRARNAKLTQRPAAYGPRPPAPANDIEKGECMVPAPGHLVPDKHRPGRPLHQEPTIPANTKPRFRHQEPALLMVAFL